MYDLFISLTFFFSGNTVFLSFVFIVLKYIFFYCTCFCFRIFFINYPVCFVTVDMSSKAV